MLPVSRRPRADQHQPAAELGDRLAGLRPGAASDRRRLPDLHAPAGDVQRRGGDRPVPAAGAARGARGLPGMQATIGNGLRQIALLLIPAGAAMLVLSDPIVQLVFERGEWTRTRPTLTADALFWFAFSLPFSGFVLMLTRAFFALQRPWVPTTLAVGSLAINAIGSYLLSKPFGIAGIVIGTTLSNVALVDRRGDLAAPRARRLRDRADARRARPDARRSGDPGRGQPTPSGGGCTTCSGIRCSPRSCRVGAALVDRRRGLRGRRAGPRGSRRRGRLSTCCRRLRRRS